MSWISEIIIIMFYSLIFFNVFYAIHSVIYSIKNVVFCSYLQGEIITGNKQFLSRLCNFL